MKESSQDQQIIAWVKDRYGRACKTEKRHGDRYSEGGLPDLNLVVYGMSIQVEDKKVMEFPRDDQLHRLLEYGTAGAISFWADTFEMFLFKWEAMVEPDPRFIFMRNEWNKRLPLGNVAEAFLEYKEQQQNNRREWLQRYKENK